MNSLNIFFCNFSSAVLQDDGYNGVLFCMLIGYVGINKIAQKLWLVWKSKRWRSLTSKDWSSLQKKLLLQVKTIERILFYEEKMISLYVLVLVSLDV